MGILLFLLAGLGVAAACSIGVSGIATLVYVVSNPDKAPPTAAKLSARKQTRDKVLLVFAAALIVGTVMQLTGVM